MYLINLQFHWSVRWSIQYVNALLRNVLIHWMQWDLIIQSFLIIYIRCRIFNSHSSCCPDKHPNKRSLRSWTYKYILFMKYSLYFCICDYLFFVKLIQSNPWRRKVADIFPMLSRSSSIKGIYFFSCILYVNETYDLKSNRNLTWYYCKADRR